MDDIDAQIVELQKKKKQMVKKNIDELLNNFCKNISEIPLNDMKTIIENKIKEDLYNNCFISQYGFWEKLEKIDYCDGNYVPQSIVDVLLPKKLQYNLLDKSFIDKYVDYDIKLYIKEEHWKKRNYINVDTFDFIVNNGGNSEYLLLFKKYENSKNYYATYTYRFSNNYYKRETNNRLKLKNQKEILELQNKSLELPNIDMTNPLYICYNLVTKLNDIEEYEILSN